MRWLPSRLGAPRNSPIDGVKRVAQLLVGGKVRKKVHLPKEIAEQRMWDTQTDRGPESPGTPREPNASTAR